MTATKYVPQHFAGVLVDDSLQQVFTPGTPYGDPPVVPLGEILTGVVVANSSDDAKQFSLHYINDAVSIYLFNELLLPAHSTTNLDLYLPLVAGQNLMALCNTADVLSLSLYGLRLEAI